MFNFFKKPKRSDFITNDMIIDSKDQFVALIKSIKAFDLATARYNFVLTFCKTVFIGVIILVFVGPSIVFVFK